MHLSKSKLFVIFLFSTLLSQSVLADEKENFYKKCTNQMENKLVCDCTYKDIMSDEQRKHHLKSYELNALDDDNLFELQLSYMKCSIKQKYVPKVNDNLGLKANLEGMDLLSSAKTNSDYWGAIRKFLIAGNEGNINALNNLGWMHLNGYGFPRNIDFAKA